MRVKYALTLFCVTVVLGTFLVSCAEKSTTASDEIPNGGDAGGETPNGGDDGGKTPNGGDAGGETPNGGDDGGETAKEGNTFSAAKCEDASENLDCFISVWNTANSDTESSGIKQVKLPLVPNGKYNFYVDWGDGTTAQHIVAFDDSNATHLYIGEDNKYTIHITGEIEGWRFYSADNKYGDAIKLLDVKQWGSLSLGNTEGRQFQGAENFNPTAVDAPNLSKTTDLSFIFSGATKFNGAIANWDVSKVTAMKGMFNAATEFDQNLLSWPIDNVTSYKFFYKDSGLELNHVPYKFRGLETVSKEQCIVNPLINCFISVWNTENSGNGSSDTNTIVLPLVGNGTYDFYVNWGDGGMEHVSPFEKKKMHRYNKAGEYNIYIAGVIKGWRFFSTTSDQGDAAKLLDVTRWGSLSLGNTAGSQFFGANNFNPTATDAPNLDETSNFHQIFHRASRFNGRIGNWDVSKITTMEKAFWNASAFNQNLNSWNVSKVTSMRGMFSGATSFNNNFNNNAISLDWGENIKNVTNMREMFMNASAFRQDISKWHVSQVTQCRDFFNNSGLVFFTELQKDVLNDKFLPPSFREGCT